MKIKKSNISRVLSLLLIVAAGTATAARWRPQAEKMQAFAEVRAAIQEELKKEAVPSLAVGVARKGKIIWEEAFGLADVERRLAATPETMYSLASISKPFTATGLMVLVERGLVDLNRPANDYLGDAKLTVYEGESSDVTVKRLLHHTAGLGTHWNFFFANEPAERPDIEESIRRYGICVWPPGTRYHYANFGYGILEHIIERVSKKSYPEFMRTEVFEPLGLSRTSVFTEEPREDFVAQRYLSSGSALPFYDFDHRGAAAVYASAHDLLRFGMFHLKNRLPGQRQILGDESISRMQTERDSGVKGSRYALGWSVNDIFGYEIVGHGGGMPGARTILRLVPGEDIAVAVLSNGSSAQAARLSNEILAALLPRYAQEWDEFKARPRQKEKPDFAIPPAYAGKWEGELVTYSGRHDFRMTLDREGHVLFRYLEDGQEQIEPAKGRLRNAEDHLEGNISIRVPTEDAARAPHLTSVYLLKKNGSLSGYAAAQAISRRYNLPSYLKLKKAGEF